MRNLVVVGAMALSVAGCVADDQVWVRTDGQTMSGNALLTNQFEVDRTICNGEVQKANMSGVVVTNGNLGANIAAGVVRGQQADDVGKGCMAQRGYLFVKKDQAAAVAQNFRETKAAAAGTKVASQ